MTTSQLVAYLARNNNLDGGRREILHKAILKIVAYSRSDCAERYCSLLSLEQARKFDSELCELSDEELQHILDELEAMAEIGLESYEQQRGSK